MINETIKDLHFLKESIGKFKDEIQKFIAEPNYSNHHVINLRHRIEDLEKKIVGKEKNLSIQILNRNHVQQNREENLPSIYTYSHNVLQYVKKGESALNNNLIKKKNNSIDPLLKQKKEYKRAMLSRKVSDPINEMLVQRRLNHLTKKETAKLINKYGIDKDDMVEIKSKRSAETANFMDKSKLLKYSNFSKNSFQAIIYDDRNLPVIKKDDMEKGMLNMIYKGLIPRNADLTSMFNYDGNPINTTSKVREIYAKNNFREEVQTEEIPKESSLFITGKGVVSNKSDTNSSLVRIKEGNQDENQDKMKEYFDSREINSPSQNNLHDSKEIKRKIKIFKKEEDDKDDNINNDIPLELKSDTNSPLNENNNFSNDEKNLTSNYLAEESLRSLKKDKFYLIFLHYKIIHNEEYLNFKNNNRENWGVLNYLIEHMQKLFRKLNYNVVEIDPIKLEMLAKDELRTFTIKDFINCLSERDLQQKGLNMNNLRLLSSNIREIFIIKIQCALRIFLARKRVKFMRNYLLKVNRIQRKFRLFRVIDASKSLIRGMFKKNLQKWNIMMDQFKTNWEKIKKSPRIEIHINSLSFNFYKNCTIEKFLEKQNNQLSRLVNLQDPNLEIIYISPYPLQNEVLSYYFSILSTLGLENAKERFHIIIPEARDFLPPNYCLSALTYFSTESLKKIKKFIKGREKFTYIVPGIVSLYDLKLSMNLKCPILMGNYDLTSSIFTKSGAKRMFEINNIPLPISAWDIKSEEGFYYSLTNLIKNYLNVNIWIFKIDNEHAGRGIASLSLSSIPNFVNLKNEKLNNILVDDIIFMDRLNSILRSSISLTVKVVNNRIYEGWSDFFAEFCRVGGIIESCPTGAVSSIVSSPAISFFIEPNGNIQSICTYDKLNVESFRNFAAISPQTTAPAQVSYLIQ
jgi:hypothetical protein